MTQKCTGGSPPPREEASARRNRNRCTKRSLRKPTLLGSTANFHKAVQINALHYPSRLSKCFPSSGTNMSHLLCVRFAHSLHRPVPRILVTVIDTLGVASIRRRTRKCYTTSKYQRWSATPCPFGTTLPTLVASGSFAMALGQTARAGPETIQRCIGSCQPREKRFPG